MLQNRPISNGCRLALFLLLAGLVSACSQEIRTEVPRCLINSDCPSPLVCIRNSCVAECRSSSDCPAGQVCQSATCIQATDSDPDDPRPDVVDEEVVAETQEEVEPTEVTETDDPASDESTEPAEEAQEDLVEEEETTTVEIPAVPDVYGSCDIFNGCLHSVCLPVVGYGLGFCTIPCPDGNCPEVPPGSMEWSCQRPPRRPGADQTCVLRCTSDNHCPDGLHCRSGGVCDVEVSGEVESYGLCDYQTGCSQANCLLREDLSAGVCARGCAIVDTCPTAPSDITATVDCVRVLPTSNACVLVCATAEDCPEGQVCEGVQGFDICMAGPQPRPVAAYQACDDTTLLCNMGTCLGVTPESAGTCAPPCNSVADCPDTPDEGFPVSCEMVDDGEYSRCVLGCQPEQSCPSGRTCNADRSLCF